MVLWTLLFLLRWFERGGRSNVKRRMRMVKWYQQQLGYDVQDWLDVTSISWSIVRTSIAQQAAQQLWSCFPAWQLRMLWWLMGQLLRSMYLMLSFKRRSQHLERFLWMELNMWFWNVCRGNAMLRSSGMLSSLRGCEHIWRFLFAQFRPALFDAHAMAVMEELYCFMWMTFWF